jgi:lipid II:glycine glycyltransferase (peptidoglycan interpeptide bridge formation enzyme)
MQLLQATIQDKEKWDQFVKDNQTGSFLQSWQWGEFIAAQGKRIWRFVVESEGEWLAVILLYKGTLKFRQTFLYSPRGPVLKSEIRNSKLESLKLVTAKIDELARQEKALYFQLEPYTTDQAWLEQLKQLGFSKSPRNVQPKYTLILDLNKSEEELLKQMHQKTRYNIRLAQKKGVKVLVDNSRINDFFALLHKTSKRQKVKFFDRNYFKKLLELDLAKLYLAEYQGRIVAANIMIFWHRSATYLFGGSDHEYRQVMAPHLLQWQAVRDAKQFGCRQYDLWGAVPTGVKGPEQKWAGVTRFKQGFDPQAEIIEYLGTYEKDYQSFKLRAYRGLKRLLGI